MDQTSGEEAAGLNRRALMGSAAAVGLAAGSGGGFGAAQAAPLAPVVSVHLDVPFVSVHGAKPYRPPIRSAADAGLVEPHELI